MEPFVGTRRLNCRLCASTDLERFLDLGHQPPADQFLTPEQMRSLPLILFPLDVYLCTKCGNVQLGYVVAPELLYQHEYPYESSTTASGRAHFAAFARAVVTDFALSKGSLAIDVGSNVGVLLTGFAAMGLRIRGVDPAPNIAGIAEHRGVPTHVGFFNPELARRIVDEEGTAAVITATNVFAHVDDLAAFMTAVEILLAPGGVFIIEAPWFRNLLRDLEYDTIYHEHLSYLSLRPLVTFFRSFGMELFDVQEVDIHGGSIRIFVARQGDRRPTANVARLLELERAERVHEMPRLLEFAEAVAKNRADLRDLIYGLKRDGARLAVVSAPAKGMTLLNFARVGVDVFDFATEKSSLKIGRVTPGSGIPVVPDSELFERRPDYALLLAWNFAQEIMRNLDVYAQDGGRFIIPIPSPHVVGVPVAGGR